MFAFTVRDEISTRTKATLPFQHGKWKPKSIFDREVFPLNMDTEKSFKKRDCCIENLVGHALLSSFMHSRLVISINHARVQPKC